MKPESIKSLRASIVTLQAERIAIERQPLSAAEVGPAVAESVEQIEAVFNVRAGLALRRIAGGQSPVTVLREVFNGPDALAVTLVGVLGAAPVADALLRQIGTVPKGLDAAARTARLAEIGAELDRLEIAEERLVEASEAAGAPIQRRDDCRPEVVLGVIA